MLLCHESLHTGQPQAQKRWNPFSWGLAESLMASSAPQSSATGAQNPKKSLAFLANARKHKHSFIQFFAMTGILLLSVRSLGQKYRIHDLQEDTSALKEEQETLTERMKNIKRNLLHEASREPTGLFASRLRLLFGEEDLIEPKWLLAVPVSSWSSRFLHLGLSFCGFLIVMW